MKKRKSRINLKILNRITLKKLKNLNLLILKDMTNYSHKKVNQLI